MFHWDPNKNRLNQSKHGISFETASMVFDDPFHLTRADHTENGERRWQTMGSPDGTVILLVVHTEARSESGDEAIRIISARRATRVERKIYEKAY
ncbi:uncharacterized DUF497 family protein [Oxalobacteraceae bacterium GrIS 2.11]